MQFECELAQDAKQREKREGGREGGKLVLSGTRSLGQISNGSGQERAEADVEAEVVVEVERCGGVKSPAGVATQTGLWGGTGTGTGAVARSPHQDTCRTSTHNLCRHA